MSWAQVNKYKILLEILIFFFLQEVKVEGDEISGFIIAKLWRVECFLFHPLIEFASRRKIAWHTF